MLLQTNRHGHLKQTGDSSERQYHSSASFISQPPQNAAPILQYCGKTQRQVETLKKVKVSLRKRQHHRKASLPISIYPYDCFKWGLKTGQVLYSLPDTEQQKIEKRFFETVCESVSVRGTRSTSKEDKSIPLIESTIDPGW